MIVAAILVGGVGRRIGGRKCERLLLGRRLLDWTVESARRQVDLVAVAARKEAPAVENVEVLFDDERLAGPLSGLQAALQWASSEGAAWLLTLPCDTPFAPCDLADRLRRAADAAQAPVALPRCRGALHPACALWRPDLGPALMDYAASRRLSLIGFAESVGYAEEEWATEPIDPFFNVNTGEDLAEAAHLAEALHLHGPERRG